MADSFKDRMQYSQPTKMNGNKQTEKFNETLRSDAQSYGVTLTNDALERLSKYYELLSRWNTRVHLVAPCTPRVFARRHVLESLVALKYLPEVGGLAEVGAGAGLPIIPCLIARPELRGLLIESAQKKAIFLREALSQIEASARAEVINQRFEAVPTPAVEVVTCRAIERFEEMLRNLLQWAPSNSTLLLFGAQRLEKKIESLGFNSTKELMPNSEGRFLYVVKKQAADSKQ